MSYKFTGDVYGNDQMRCDDSLSLAIATVPIQEWRMTYTPEKALCAGTMFAELNLPFEGGRRR